MQTNNRKTIDNRLFRRKLIFTKKLRKLRLVNSDMTEQ